MAPSRGLTLLLSRTRPPVLIQKFHRSYSTTKFTSHATSPQSRMQIYISRSLNPYLNLSIEHYLLQKTPEDSTILFLYTNTNSIIIGRNQNPWTEVHLSALRDNNFQLVRRRSGGGTVMHDEGNVNYSIICPSKVFDRDKHASMVVRALSTLGVDNARVNCRHDIVVDVDGEGGKKTFKVSGSAYKLTRLRSLHHGTCLLSSANLKLASSLLTSPGKAWITARGVESVRSPIKNVNVGNEEFEDAVVSEFKKLYETDVDVTIVGDEEGEVPEIAKGLKELVSEEWIYEQTPQFTFTTEIPNRSESAGGKDFPEDFKASFTIRHGTVTSSDIAHPVSLALATSQTRSVDDTLLSTPLHKIKSWDQEIFPAYNDKSEVKNPGVALNTIFGLGTK